MHFIGYFHGLRYNYARLSWVSQDHHNTAAHTQPLLLPGIVFKINVRPRSYTPTVPFQYAYVIAKV